MSLFDKSATEPAAQALPAAPVSQPLLNRFMPILLLTAICWMVFIVNNLLLHGHLGHYGIVPRQVDSLLGIIWAPFLHANFKHLAANTVPLLVLGGILCARSRTEFALVTIGAIVGGGGLTWLVARNACHIGASGVIFCFFGYLASLAWFKRTFGTLCLSVVCILAYGGMIRGVMPTSTAVSWEGHLAGLVVGVALAAVASKLRDTKPDGLGSRTG